MGKSMSRITIPLVSAALCLGLLNAPSALAGQDANFVLYNHHNEEQGATEVEVYSDYGFVGRGEPNYIAQLFEIEYGVTDLLSTAIYLEGAKTFEDERYEFGSLRFENRLRLFRHETLLNPVLYAEYIYKRQESRYVRDVVGRVDGEEEEEEEDGSEHELETKVILGHDITKNLNVAFNTIQEVNLENGHWAFGYATGLNYAFFRAYDLPPGFGDLSDSDVRKLILGLELFGGLGDSEKGLTLDGSKTEQYLGINLRADFKNDIHVGIGGALGLTEHSEDAIFRLKAGVEFE